MDIQNVNDLKGIFFRVIAQTPLSQAAVMTVPAGGDTGPEEIHDGDQLVYVISGTARAEINHRRANLTGGDVVIIPKGAQHHIANDGAEDLFFLTVYAPPQY